LQLDITALNDEIGDKNQKIAELERKLQAATTLAGPTPRACELKAALFQLFYFSKRGRVFSIISLLQVCFVINIINQKFFLKYNQISHDAYFNHFIHSTAKKFPEGLLVVMVLYNKYLSVDTPKSGLPGERFPNLGICASPYLDKVSVLAKHTEDAKVQVTLPISLQFMYDSCYLLFDVR